MKKTCAAVVLGLVTLFLTVPSFALDENQKQVIKDAIVGAVTGAAATEATKDEKTPEANSNLTIKNKKHEHHEGDEHDKKGKKHKKDKKRPHGWDQGKKTGWGDSDVPPGLAKKKK